MKRKIGLLTAFVLFYVLAMPSAGQAGETYARVWAGAAWLHDTIDDYDVDFDTGVACGAVCGTTWFRYIRTEVEALYLHDQISNIKALSTKTETAIRGKVDDFAALVNLAAELPLNFYIVRFSPYLGGGIGASYAKSQLHISSLLSEKETECRFAYQGFAGISFTLLPCLLFEINGNLEARYLVFDEHARAILAIAGVGVRF